MAFKNLNIVLFVGVFAITGCQKAKLSQVPAEKPAAPQRGNPRNIEGGGVGGGTGPAAPAPTPTTRRATPVPPARAVTTGTGATGLQDVEIQRPETSETVVIEAPTTTVTVSTQDSVVIAAPDNQEWRLNREPILAPPPKRSDNVVPWYESNKPYNSVLKVCGTPERPCPPPEMVLLPAPPAPPPETPRIVFNEPLTPHTKALDILFVVDTSDSMDVVLMEIAQQIGKFVENLPPHNDYNVGVMLAHSPGSEYASRLYTMDSRDAAVLKSSSMNINQIRDNLVKKIASVKLHRDRLNGQGELGLLAVQNAFTDQQNIQSLKNAGFLREHAGLTVIFVTDEQDVCFDYSAFPHLKPHYTPGIGKNDSVKRDWFEYEAFNTYCKPNGVLKVTSESVMKAIKSVKQDRPATVSGIIYLTEQAIKNSHLNDAYRLEHEIGYGIKELIEYAGDNGQAIELGAHNFGRKMAQLGLFNNLRLSFVNKFEIKESPNLVKPSSIEVRLIYPPKSNKQPKMVGGNDIRYEAPYVIVSDKAIIQGFIPGTKVEVTYKYKNTNY